MFTMIYTKILLYKEVYNAIHKKLAHYIDVYSILQLIIYILQYNISFVVIHFSNLINDFVEETYFFNRG